ncbi:MAG: RNA-binding protein [Nitrososphaerales archaeon]
MNFSNMEASLAEATKRFNEIVSRRERLIKESRDVIALSAKAIVSVHTSNFAEAKKLRGESRKKLDELRVIAGSDLTKYLLTPEQEFVECSAVLAMRSGAKLPSRKQLGVSNLSYILGLLDSIGELKRSVFDAIRKNDFSTAEDLFRSMEQLYLLLSPFAVYDNIAQGVKRKLDVARILIEDTRATITEEARRREFITAVNKLSERLGEVKN